MKWHSETDCNIALLILKGLPLVNQQFGYVRFTARSCGDQYNTGTITTQFCFTYTLEGVTAMPRGLHARLCIAFLVGCFGGKNCGNGNLFPLGM